MSRKAKRPASTGQGAYLTELRRSNAAGTHGPRRPNRSASRRNAIRDSRNS